MRKPVRTRISSKDVDVAWRLARDAGPLQPFLDDASPLEGSGRVFRINRALIRDGNGLGLSLRLHVIRRFLDAPIGSFFEVARDRYGGDPSINTGSMDRLFQIASGETLPSRYPELLEPVAAWVDHKRADLGPLGKAALFDDVFDGRDAPAAFGRLLERSSRQPLIVASRFVIGRNENRERIEEAVLAELGRAAEPRKRPQILNIHAEGLWSGLAAFAAHIAAKVASNDRAALVIPLRRAREFGPERTMSRPEILGLPHIIGILLALVRDGPGAVAKAAEFHDADDLGEAIYEIRLGLAKKPAVLIFDGHYLPEDGYDPIERHVGDDHLVSLLQRLLDPPICSAEQPRDDGTGRSAGVGPLDLERFARNQIVVTSNRRLAELEDITPVPGASKPFFHQLDPPDPEAFDEVLDLQGLVHGKTVRRLYDSERLANRRADLAHVLDAFAGAVEAAEVVTDRPALPEFILSRLPRASDASDLQYAGKAVTELLRYLSEARPAWVDLLGLVSMTPDGLRPGSVTRFARRAGRIPEEVRPFAALAEAHKAGRLRDEIEAASAALAPIFGLVRADLFDGLDGIPHPLELDEEYDDRLDEPRGRSLDFIDPEIKLVVRTNTVEDFKPNVFHAAQRLLAEEALTQQTISLRHVDGTSLANLRPWRRMLSAFHHGLQSLPIGRRPDGTPCLAPLDLGGHDLVSTGSPAEFWLYLYAFCYRRMLERPPAWNLARLYGLDGLKATLLASFDKPWELWPKEFRGRRPRGPKGLIGELPERARHDWAVSLAQAEVARGELLSALNVVTAKEKGGLSPVSALKREMDVRILQGRPIGDLVPGRVPPDLRSAFEDDRATAHLDEVADHLFRIVRDGRMSALETDLKEAESTSTRRLITSMTPDIAGGLSDVADIFFRVAEAEALKAELAYAINVEGWRPDSLPEILGDNAVQDEEQIARAFCTSLSLYRFAEQLRLRAFSDEPTGNHFFVSGHQIRQAIRIALKLERMARSRAETAGGSGKIGLFGRFARRNADTLTRHLFRYPRERASQLILESTMLRHLAPDESRHRHLTVARGYLAEAERQVIGLGQAARIRMRLSLERLKLSRDLWRLSRDPKQRAIYEDQCRYDVASLKWSARKPDLPLWQALAEIQEAKLSLF